MAHVWRALRTRSVDPCGPPSRILIGLSPQSPHAGADVTFAFSRAVHAALPNGRRTDLGHTVIGREQAVAHEIRRSPRPGFVGIAAHVDAHRRDHLSSMDVTQIDVDIENEVGNLLHQTGNNEVSPELPRILYIATAAGL